MVTLNIDSKLSYPKVFNGSTRDVYLTGEAYFDVKHDPLKPFLVHSGEYVTVVMGTAFNVEAYPSRDNMSVTVTRGKVKVENSNNKALGILFAGDQLVINKSSVSSKIERANVEKVLKWKKEDLVFENITFNEAAVIISNRFGVEVLFENDGLRNCRFTGKFSSDHTMEEMLDIICMLTRSYWHKENKSVIRLSGNGCD
jgi:ferric-dicitrate binding protein FerR (iron transport regulator)